MPSFFSYASSSVNAAGYQLNSKRRLNLASKLFYSQCKDAFTPYTCDKSSTIWTRPFQEIGLALQNLGHTLHGITLLAQANKGSKGSFTRVGEGMLSNLCAATLNVVNAIFSIFILLTRSVASGLNAVRPDLFENENFGYGI